MIMREGGVRFWLHGGTLLGAIRHGGMIPWDCDIDVGMDRPDLLPGLVGRFATEGLALQKNRTDAYWQVGTNRPGEPISPSHIDIFPFRFETATDQYVITDPRFRDEAPDSPEAHCNIRFTEQELFPLKTIRFYGWEEHIPQQSEKVLGRALGPHYMTVARVRVPGGPAEEYPLTDRTPA